MKQMPRKYDYSFVVMVLIMTMTTTHVRPAPMGPRHKILDLKVAMAIPEDADLVLFSKNSFYFSMADFQEQMTLPIRSGNNLLFQLVGNERTDGYFFLARRNRNGKGYFHNGEYDSASSIFYFEPGDSLGLKLAYPPGSQKPTLSFNGKNAARYNTSYLAQATWIRTALRTAPPFSAGYDYSDPCMAKGMAALGIIEANRLSLGPNAYNMLRAEAYFQGSKGSSVEITLGYDRLKGRQNKDSLDKFRTAMARYYLKKETIDIPRALLARSRAYLDYLYYKTSTLIYLDKDTLDKEVLFNKILSDYSGKVRDELITKMFIQERLPKSVASRYEFVCSIIKDQNCLEQIRKVRNLYGESHELNFRLPDRDGKMHHSDEYLNQVVVIDLWFTGCAGCIYTYKNVLGPLEEKYRGSRQVRFVSINVDRDRSKWLGSLDGRGPDIYTSLTGATNLHTDGQGTNHPFLKRFSNMGYPFLILVGRDGKIEKLNDPLLYRQSSLDAAIEKLMSTK